MMMLNIGLLAIVAAFNSGAIALKSAGEVSTASVLGDKQMELYRALKYTEIALDTTAVATANGDTTYQCDPANKVDPAGACGGGNQQTQQQKTCGTMTPQCNPRQTVTGPDQRSYRVDTYVVAQTPPTGRTVKLVTIVVRRARICACSRACRPRSTSPAASSPLRRIGATAAGAAIRPTGVGRSRWPAGSRRPPARACTPRRPR